MSTSLSTGGIVLTPEEAVKAEENMVKYETEQEAMKHRTQTACANCQGFCCLAFELSYNKGDIPKRMEALRIEIAQLQETRERRHVLAQLYHGVMPKVDFYLERRLEMLIEHVGDSKVIKDMLIRLPVTRHMSRDADGKPRKIYTCKHFDVKARRCGIYERRPAMCRTFLCDTAKKGVPPPIETMHAHPSRTPSVGAKLTIPWTPFPTTIPGFPELDRKWLGVREVGQRKVVLMIKAWAKLSRRRQLWIKRKRPNVLENLRRFVSEVTHKNLPEPYTCKELAAMKRHEVAREKSYALEAATVTLSADEAVKGPCSDANDSQSP